MYYVVMYCHYNNGSKEAYYIGVFKDYQEYFEEYENYSIQMKSYTTKTKALIAVQRCNSTFDLPE